MYVASFTFSHKPSTKHSSPTNDKCAHTKCTCVPHLLYPLQDGDTPLHLALRHGHTTYVECLLSAPGIDINIKDGVSWSIEE